MKPADDAAKKANRAMNKRHFDISRKIIANMTSESWKNIPHFASVYEADAELLASVIDGYNTDHPDERISINIAMLKAVVEGIKTAPRLNGHFEYNGLLLSGTVTEPDHIDISFPMRYGGGKMMTVTLPHMEDRSMRDIRALIEDLRKRIDDTDMEAVMYLTGLNDTLEKLRRGRLIKAAGRLAGAKFGKSRVNVPARRMIGSLNKGRSGECLSFADIKQGSITVSSVGAVCREWSGAMTLLEVVPPQLCAIAIGAMQKKPVAVGDHVEIRRVVPITIACDHRALDFGDAAPLIERMNGFLQSREEIESSI